MSDKDNQSLSAGALQLSGTVLKSSITKKGKFIVSVLVEDTIFKFLTDIDKFKAGTFITQISIRAFAVEGGFLGQEA